MVARCVKGRAAKWFAVLGGVVLTLTAVADSADARGRRHRRSAIHRPAYNPPFAAIVVDANSGRVLTAQNPDSLRHPASITKVMTLYMLFEQLEKRRYTLQTMMPVSAHSASMPPTKLGVRPGGSISIDHAIRAIVTKSANDMAATVAEFLGGSEDNFARLMTRKAHSLGMTRTNFANASGLPDPDQVTTARDLSILGRAIQERFPQYFHYFSTPSFQYGYARMANHNRLLGRIEGVDGIKTGYTRASGFNLLTSARRGNQRIVAVVLGGRSGGQRDQIMADLVESHIGQASGRRTAPMIAERPAADEPRVAALAPAPQPPVRPQVAAAPVDDDEDDAPKAAPARAPTPVAPVKVAAAPVDPRPVGRPMALAAYAPQPVVPAPTARPAVISATPRAGDLVPTATIPNNDGSTRVAAGGATTPSNLRWVSGPRGFVKGGDVQPRAAFVAPATANELRPAKSIPVAAAAPVPAPRPAPKAAPVEDDEETTVSKVRPAGMVVQVGATDDPDKAKALIDRARTRSPQLVRARPFTEKVNKGGETLYRARFAGLDEQGANAACRDLKRSGLGCFTTRN